MPFRCGDRVGSFKYFRDEERWEWSDAVAQMHGYAPGAVEPTTALVMSHKHPDDAPTVALLIESVAGQGQPFSSRHRIIDTTGRTHSVLVVGEQLCAGEATPSSAARGSMWISATPAATTPSRR